MHKIVFDNREDLTAKDIEQLKARRNEIFEALNKLYEAAKQLYRREPTYPDIEPFLATDVSEDAITAAAFKVFLEREGDKMGILPAKAAEALGHTPDDVKEVLAAWREYDKVGSEDPHRYWSDTKQKFRALPPTQNELEAIAERNKLFVIDEEKLELVKFARSLANAINYASTHHYIRTTPAAIKSTLPFLASILRSEKEKGMGNTLTFTWKPNYLALCDYDSTYRAFDE